MSDADTTAPATPQPPQEAAVSGQAVYYRHVKSGQYSAERSIDNAAHDVRDYLLRVARNRASSNHRLNDLAYPQNAQARSAMESIERARIGAYRAVHLESRRDGSDRNSIEAVGTAQAAIIKAIAFPGEPVWYPKVASAGPISEAAGYAGGTYEVSRPQAASDWSLVLVVSHPTIEGGPVPSEQGAIWLDSWGGSSYWSITERPTATSLVLTLTGNRQIGQKEAIELIARSDIAPSKLTLNITIT